MGGARQPSAHLGPRGEGWVALQLALLGLAVAAGLDGPSWPAPVRGAFLGAGCALGAGGAALFALACASLGRSLTPFPRPTVSGELVRGGLYARARHPIYGGLLVASAGFALATSPLALAAAAALALLLALKARAEEAWLLERYPGYGDYRAATPAGFLPRPLALRSRRRARASRSSRARAGRPDRDS